MSTTPLPKARVDVVVVHYNAPEALEESLEPLVGGLVGDELLTLVVLDNDSRQPFRLDRSVVPDGLPEDRAAFVQRRRNDGFGVACNEGARLGRSPYILFLNPDCVIDVEGIQTLAGELDDDPKVVAIGPRIIRPDGLPEISWAHHPGFVWEAKRRRLWRALGKGKPWAVARARDLVSAPREVEWLTAACLLVRRSAFEQVGGFDEDFFLYFEDADLGLRLGRVGSLRFTPSVEVCHRGGASAAKGNSGTLPHYRRSQHAYYRKHRPAWERFGLRVWRLIKP